MWIYVKTVLQLIKVWIFRDVDISFKSLVNFISTHEGGDIGVKAFMWGSAQMVVFMMTYIWADGLSAVSCFAEVRAVSSHDDQYVNVLHIDMQYIKCWC